MRRIVATIGALALLLGLAGMSLATEPPTYDWGGNGYPNATCNADSATSLWIWTGDSPTSLTINGQVQAGSWTQMGNGSWHFTVTNTAGNYPPITASVTYTGTAGMLTLSHCEGVQPTPTPTPTPIPTPTPTPTPTPIPTPTPSPTATVAPVVTPTPSPTATVAAETGTPTPTPTATVAAETGTPAVTPPPTDILGSVQSAPSSNGWYIVLIGLATLILSVLVFAKPRRSSGRR